MDAILFEVAKTWVGRSSFKKIAKSIKWTAPPNTTE